LTAARAAPKAATEKLVSAIGAGEFRLLRQNKEDDEPKLWSMAKVHVYFDRDKYHVQLAYDKMVVLSSKTASGKSNASLVDGKYDDVRIIANDDAVYVVNFSKSIHPTGCGGKIYARDQLKTAAAASGFPWSEPVRIWRELPDMDGIIKNIGADAVAFSEIGEGRFLARYPAGNPTAEFEVERTAGFNVTRCRVLNPKQKDPVQKSDATWKQVKDTWFVTEFVEEWDNREVDPERGYFRRSTLKYETFEANVRVGPDLFALKSVPIPVGSRFIDRRQKAASRFQYWNGTALQAENR